MKFGFLARHLSLASTQWQVEVLPEFGEALAAVKDSQSADSDWFWPPTTVERPIRPAGWFELPTTHRLSLDGIDAGIDPGEADHLAVFLIALLGFLFGLELLPEHWRHSRRVALTPHKLTDLSPTDGAVVRILDFALRRWLAEPLFRERFLGLVRWHALSLTTDEPHELFAAQYMLFDACWKIRELRVLGADSHPHAERITVLAKECGVPVPSNWQLELRKNSPFVQARNELFHEAKWRGQPIGFVDTTPGGSLQWRQRNNSFHLELAWFNMRIILALLGDNSPQLSSPIAGRLMRYE